MSQPYKLSDVYIVAVFGLLGAHHFYLGRRKFGLLYLFTLGLFGIGFIYDLYRMKQLVDHVNNNPKDEFLISDLRIICLVLGPVGGHHFYLGNHGLGVYYAVSLGSSLVGWIVDLLRIEQLVEERYHYMDDEYSDDMKLCVRRSYPSLATAYILAMPPLGVLGAYHCYLGNTRFIIYMLTCGVFGLGWLIDLFQMYILVAKARDVSPDIAIVKRITYYACLSPIGILGAHHFMMGRHCNGLFYLLTFGYFGVGWVLDVLQRLPVLLHRYKDNDEHKYIDDAYMYWLPFGVFGLHHIYLGRPKWGIAYLCTCGFLCIGWVVDGFRMPNLVQEANNNISGDPVNKFPPTQKVLTPRNYGTLQNSPIYVRPFNKTGHIIQC